MKKIISVLMTLILLSSLFATFSVSTSAATNYVESFFVVQDGQKTLAQRYVSQNGYILIDADLNKNCAYSDYMYLGYKTTNDQNNAIRDVIALADKEYGNKSSWTNPDNNCVYYPVGGINNGVYQQNMDINATTGGIYIYLFATKDPNAGAPISDPVVNYEKYYTGRNSYLVIYGDDSRKHLSTGAGLCTSNPYIYFNRNGYISDLRLGSAFEKSEARIRAEKDNYKIVSNLELNDEAGGHYIYLSEKITNNAYEAIRDIVILDGSEYGNMSSWYNNANGCTYYPVGGYMPGWYNAIDLNSKAGGDWLYLYYTKDSRAGDPITGVSPEYNDMTGWTTVKFAGTNERANVNKGAGGDTIYVLYSRTSLVGTGSIFTEANNITILIVCSIVIIIGIIMGIYFTKKRKTIISA